MYEPHPTLKIHFSLDFFGRRLTLDQTLFFRGSDPDHMLAICSGLCEMAKFAKKQFDGKDLVDADGILK